MRLHLPEASALRGLDHTRIDRILEIRGSFGQRMRRTAPAGSWHNAWEKVVITDEVRRNLHSMADFLLAWPEPYAMTIMSDWVYLYSQGRDLQQAVIALEWLDQRYISTTTVDLIGPPDHVVLKKANHAYRSYFRNQLVDQPTLLRVKNVLINQEDLRMGPSLSWSMDRELTRFFDHYFIDHNNAYVLTLLALIKPNLVRKTVPISSINN